MEILNSLSRIPLALGTNALVRAKNPRMAAVDTSILNNLHKPRNRPAIKSGDLGR